MFATTRHSLFQSAMERSRQGRLNPRPSRHDSRQGRGIIRLEWRVGKLPLRRLLILLIAMLLSGASIAPAADAESDDLIYDHVRRELVNDRDLKTNLLKVEVDDGVVTVSGYVKTEKLRKRVDKVVKKAKGVKGVVNKVEVRP